VDRKTSSRTIVFGIVSGARAWRCRLDVDGDSSLSVAEVRNLNYAISRDSMGAILRQSDDVAAMATAIVAEWIRLYRGPTLPLNFAEMASPFICSWICDVADLPPRAIGLGNLRIFEQRSLTKPF
jgi:hypothetical protein